MDVQEGTMDTFTDRFMWKTEELINKAVMTKDTSERQRLMLDLTSDLLAQLAGSDDLSEEELSCVACLGQSLLYRSILIEEMRQRNKAVPPTVFEFKRGAREAREPSRRKKPDPSDRS
jgi:hypothetical protein